MGLRRPVMRARCDPNTSMAAQRTGVNQAMRISVCNGSPRLRGEVALPDGRQDREIQPSRSAQSRNASRSFGKHAPPRGPRSSVPYSAFHIASELCATSENTRSASTPMATATLRSSLKNEIFKALARLCAYFWNSASRIGTRYTGHSNPAYNRSAASPERSSSCPMTTSRGASESLTALRWRRYSGLMHTPKSRPAWSPPSASSSGMTTSSVVPGGTVLRTMTTRYRPGSTAEARPDPAPIAATAASS